MRYNNIMNIKSEQNLNYNNNIEKGNNDQSDDIFNQDINDYNNEINDDQDINKEKIFLNKYNYMNILKNRIQNILNKINSENIFNKDILKIIYEKNIYMNELKNIEKNQNETINFNQYLKDLEQKILFYNDKKFNSSIKSKKLLENKSLLIKNLLINKSNTTEIPEILNKKLQKINEKNKNNLDQNLQIIYENVKNEEDEKNYNQDENNKME